MRLIRMLSQPHRVDIEKVAKVLMSQKKCLQDRVFRDLICFQLDSNILEYKVKELKHQVLDNTTRMGKYYRNFFLLNFEIHPDYKELGSHTQLCSNGPLGK